MHIKHLQRFFKSLGWLNLQAPEMLSYTRFATLRRVRTLLSSTVVKLGLHCQVPSIKCKWVCILAGRSKEVVKTLPFVSYKGKLKLQH